MKPSKETIQTERPYVLSIAGLDPSGGAGLLADIKTFEQLSVYGLGVCTAVTVQTGAQFISSEWIPLEQIIAQLKPLLQTYPVDYCKIGIVQDVFTLLSLINQLQQLRPGIRIVLDPVLKATAGFSFHGDIHWNTWKELLPSLHLLTPNYEEAKLLTGEDSGETAAGILAAYSAVLLKGGHHPSLAGYDTLFAPEPQLIVPTITFVSPKHGSGCVLSAAITAWLAKGASLTEACTNGKAYTEQLLSSNHSLLGFHKMLQHD
ncbi:hydroxymethylpyrimidine/phosphomethylpyrimidine kinase [Chitinophaga dinghuensis]|uniref:hydroxymethylpyrimidine kinase n=1 Tax=Chitinophaga dinghuensis TaxID=1539050 RepID=A0A327W4C9_9BACT|nr:hydroxymethylpyrimidine/phosphomethylpyrimidine kinase [Chitinophaga dinghuensis]RAJ85369.1 hydroxymethylpyrimidine/phosphomethylpyrimidine kinase [Chitinophaga dinghuensis]